MKSFYSAYHYDSGKIFYFIKKPTKQDLLAIAKKYDWDFSSEKNPANFFEITLCKFTKQED